jgi:3',5'-cyclic AMP phosphodiesterase CpdA
MEMPRRIKLKETKRDWRWWTSMLLNGAVVLSMVFGSIIVFTGLTPRQAIPTIEVPTAAPATVAPPTLAPAATPTPKASVNYQFAVAGDSRGGDAIYSKILERVARDGSAFLIHTGDLVPSDTPDNWSHFLVLMKGFTLPFYPVPGNHDISAGKNSGYLQSSGATAMHYSFDRGAVHFTFVDSSLGSLFDSEFTYLDNDLAASQAPIKIVVIHHPPFDPAGGTHIMANGGDRFMRIVKERGAKYVFAGHIHCYEEAERDGIKYLIIGGGGAPLYCAPTAGGFYHYVRVQVTGETLTTEVVKID